MNIDDIDRRLQVGINAVLLLLVFFLPLLVSTRSSEVFELPKMLFVYPMTAAIAGLWLGRMLARREILIRRTPLDIPILLFLLSQMASTIYSIDPAVSWWGWYGRFHGGLWSTISYTLLYYAFVSNISENSEYSDSQNVRKSESQKTRNSGTPIFRFSDFSGSQSFLSVLVKTILASAAVVSVYAVLQHFGVDKNFWVQDVANRVFSTQGQPNWLGGYLVMTIPLAFAMTISEIINQKPYSSLLQWNEKYMISYFLFMIYALALLWTKSRSGLVGLAVADLVFWLLIFFRFYLLKKRSCIDQQRSFKKEPTFLGTKKLYRLSTIVHNLYNFVVKNKDREKVSLVNLAKPFILIHVLMAGLILTTNNPAKEYIFQKSQLISAKISSNQIMDKSDKSASETSDLSVIRFLADFSRDSDFSGTALRKSEYGGTESGDIRRIVWNGAIQLVKQRPIFGFGPETFGETYWRVRPKEHNLTSEWNYLYNKAHNEWLNLAANTGILGLGSHLLLLTWFSIWAMRSFANFSRDEKFAKLNYLAAILAGLIGVEAVNFFGFSTVTVGVYRYLFMGMAIVSASEGRILKGVSLKARRRQESTVYCLLFTVSLAVLYLISQILIFFLADLDYNRGRAYQDGGYVEEAVEPLMRAVSLAPAEPVFRAELAEAEGVLASLINQKSDIINHKDELINRLEDDSLVNFEIVRKQSPYNLGFVRTEAKMLFLLGNCGQGQRDPSAPPAAAPQDDHCNQALQLMKLAMEMAPTNPQLPYSLGQMLSKMGKEEEAAVFYNKAVELKTDYPAIPISE